MTDHSLPAKAGGICAVMIRSYQCDAKYRNLMEKLSRDRRSFDLYAIVNDTNGRSDSGEWPTIWHSLSGFGKLGLMQAVYVIRNCSDYPFYVALTSIPSYRYYIMIEDDVELVDNNADFVNALCDALVSQREGTVDLAGPFFRRDHGLIWGAATEQAYTREHCYMIRFPFVVLSRRLCAYLFALRQLEAAQGPPEKDVMHCEAFVPSAAMAAGFNCCALNDLFPGSHDKSLMTMEYEFGRTMDISYPNPIGVRMYHPVYSTSEWIRRVLHEKAVDSRGSRKFGNSFLDKLQTLAFVLSRAQMEGNTATQAAAAKLAEHLSPEDRRILETPAIEVPLLASIDEDDAVWSPIKQTPGANICLWTRRPRMLHRWTQAEAIRWRVHIDHPVPLLIRFVVPVIALRNLQDGRGPRLRVLSTEITMKWRGQYEGEAFYADVYCKSTIPDQVTLILSPADSSSKASGQTDPGLLCLAVPIGSSGAQTDPS